MIWLLALVAAVVVAGALIARITTWLEETGEWE